MALHLKSLQSAYRSSPYFEYFEDEFIALYSKKENFLVDFNIKCLQLILECLDININHSFTEKYTKKSLDSIDLRDFSIARKENNIELKKYIQVFDSKHGFISNLSILDLLFNEGNNSLNLIN